MAQGNGMSNGGEVSPLEALRRLREESMGERTTQGPDMDTTTAPQSSMKEQLKRESERTDKFTTPREPIARSDNSSSNTPNGSNNALSIISKIQYYLFLTTLLLIPSFILPLPWGWAEYPKGILLLVMTTLLVTMEVMKMFMSGKFSMIKGFLDIAVLLIFGSYLLSTLFSKDLGSSMYGYDMRLGTGFLAITGMIAFFFVGRSFIRSKDRFQMVIMFANIGIALSALLSLLSFFGLNLFAPFGAVDDLFVPGFPLMAASVIGIVVWGVGMLISMVDIMLSHDRPGYVAPVAFVLAIFELFAILMFSLSQGLSVLVLLGVVMVLMMIFVLMNRKLFKGGQVTMMAVLVVAFAIGAILLRVPSVNEGVVESTDAIVQIALPGQTTWQIVTNTLSENIGIGLMGFGVDTFSIYFNIYKPAVLGNVDLSTTNFTFGNSEILTVMGNRGVLGALIWLAIGILILYQTIKDFTTKGRADTVRITLLAFDLILLFVFLSSSLVFYGFSLYFVLFMLFSFRVLIGALLEPRDAESFVMQLDLLVEKVGQSKSDLLPAGLALVAALVGLFVLNLNITSIRANLKALAAEDRIVEVQNAIARADVDREADQPSNYPLEDREEALLDIIDRYAAVVELQPDDSQFHRRRALLLLDYMNLLVEKANTISEEYREENGEDADLQDSAELQEVQGVLTQVVEIAIEETRQATEIAPLLFANWDTRGYLYSQLVNLNLTSYADSGIAATDRAVRLNPTNYLSYFRAAQLFVVAERFEDAGATISRALQINPNHIPSLLLATELSIASEDFDTAKALLERGLQILEAVEAQDTEVYTIVEDRLAQVEEAIANGGVLEEELDPDELPNENDDPLQGEEVDDEELPDEPVDTGLGDEEQVDQPLDTGEEVVDEQPAT